MASSTTSVILFLLLTVVATTAFVLPSGGNSAAQRSNTWGTARPSTRRTAVEQLEFTIFPDGRIEETVRGIKGENCHKVTDDINQHLGKVVATSPTEEMYENEVVVDQVVTDSVKSGGDESGGSGGGWSSGANASW